jgi:Protein of unknown function (DUF3570)
MRKLSLTAIGFYFSILTAFSQNTTTDSSSYKSRKLTLDEVNFVSGYYHQNGNHSAVTGGIGTENLTDFANTLELKLSHYDARQRKHAYSLELGVDHYTSASSDKIDPYTISSASMADTRYYPSVAWSLQNEQKGTTFGLNTSYSKEYDYKSFGFGGFFTKASKDNNRELTLKAQAFLDTWKVIYPIELIPPGYGTGAHEERGGGGRLDYIARNSYNASLSFSQIINQRMQVLFVIEPTYQKGLLATKYQRVFFTDGSEQPESLPNDRFKIPIGIRANYFLGDRVILRSFYRYYQDNWGLRAHTVEVELPVKVNPFFSFSPFYRFYMQNGIGYFAPYGAHLPGETYFTSDYDLSKFSSHYAGANFRFVPENGVLGVKHWNSLEIRYGHYIRSTDLNSDQITLALQFK